MRSESVFKIISNYNAYARIRQDAICVFFAFFTDLCIKTPETRTIAVPNKTAISIRRHTMTIFDDTKRENSDKNRRSNPNERKRTDSNRDGDSRRNRSDDDLYGADES